MSCVGCAQRRAAMTAAMKSAASGVRDNAVTKAILAATARPDVIAMAARMKAFASRRGQGGR